MKNFAALLFISLSATAAQAQAATGDTSWTRDEVLNYLTLIGTLVLFGFLVLRSFYVATVTLKRNGEDATLRFPMVKSFATNPKTVAFFMILVILTGICWALCYV